MQTENVAKLKSLIQEAQRELVQISDQEMQQYMGPGKWCGKELLGHLTDSAAMNRQRIIRSQYEELYDFPGYMQATWVQVQGYASSEWTKLVTLFVAEYEHLLHMLEIMPQAKADDLCPVRFEDSNFVTLDWLVGHMNRHIEHHLQQIYWLVGKSELPEEKEMMEAIAALPKRIH